MITSNKIFRLKELHVQRMKGPLSPSEDEEYKSLKKGWKARRLCKDLDQVYKDPRMQELLRTKPTEQRWYDLMDELLHT